MFAQLKDVESRYHELEQLLSDPAVLGKPGVYQKYAKEHSDLSTLVEIYREYEKTSRRIEEDQALLRDSDEEMRELAKEELPQLKENLGALEERLKGPSRPVIPTTRRTSFSKSGPGPGG